MESKSKGRQKRSISLISAMLTAMLVGAVVGLTGCNTTQGVGEDIEAAGDALSDAARDAND